MHSLLCHPAPRRQGQALFLSDILKPLKNIHYIYIKQVKQVSPQVGKLNSIVLNLTVENCAFNQNQLLDTWELFKLYFPCM